MKNDEFGIPRYPTTNLDSNWPGIDPVGDRDLLVGSLRGYRSWQVEVPSIAMGVQYLGGTIPIFLSSAAWNYIYTRGRNKMKCLLGETIKLTGKWSSDMINVVWVDRKTDGNNEVSACDCILQKMDQIYPIDSYVSNRILPEQRRTPYLIPINENWVKHKTRCGLREATTVKKWIDEDSWNGTSYSYPYLSLIGTPEYSIVSIHDYPPAGCHCGFYGWYNHEHVNKYHAFIPGSIVGCARFSGKMSLNTLGFRAQYSEIEAISVQSLDGVKYALEQAYPNVKIFDNDEDLLSEFPPEDVTDLLKGNDGAS